MSRAREDPRVILSMRTPTVSIALLGAAARHNAAVAAAMACRKTARSVANWRRSAILRLEIASG
jgi:hypothetical protein